MTLEVIEQLISPSRSNRRLIKDIGRRAEVRERLLQEQKLSLPSGLGKLAIIVSRAPNYSSFPLTPEEQYQAFMNEAERLRQERMQDHQEVVIKPSAVVRDMTLDFGDPEITDIILIGHGNISAIWASGGNHFDWLAAAKAATYLKQGKIEQRMCGNLPNKRAPTIPGENRNVEQLPHSYAVPLGTFAVSKLANITAAVGMSIPDIHPADELFAPVFTSGSDNIPEEVRIFNETYGNVPTEVIT